MGPSESAHVMPGCLAWTLVALVFVVSGEWVDSAVKASHHPYLLVLVGVSVPVAAVWMAVGKEKLWLLPLTLIATVISSTIVLLIAFLVADIAVFQFSLFGRSFGLGRLLTVLLPVLLAAYAVAASIAASFLWLVDKLRARRAASGKRD